MNLRKRSRINLKSSFLLIVRGEEGSLSLLIIGLFVAAVTALMVITDVAVVANAKRTLDQATEAAAMRAVQNLDKTSYYSGKHTILTSAYMALGNSGYANERIPIDCEAGWREVNNEVNTWSTTSTNLKTLQMKNYEITMYDCVYEVVHLETKATVKLPFPAPVTNLDEFIVKSAITTQNEKDKGLWLFGFRLH
jgi:uncharacterized membrane protein